MPDFESIETRDISGKGILKVPEDNQFDRAFVLYVDVVRKPKGEYKNLLWSPPKSHYAKLTFTANDYVVAEYQVDFTQQAFEFLPDVCNETLLAIQCSYKGILASFANLGTALGLTLVSVEDKIADYQQLKLFWDTVRVSCYADTAVSLNLYSLALDSCGDIPPPIPPRRPKPPTPPPVPPGDPFETSPPYDSDTSDDGGTEPFPGDGPPPPEPPPTQGDVCSPYRIVYTYTKSNGDDQTNSVIGVWGKFGSLRIDSTNSKVQIFCQGLVTSGACQPTTDWYDVIEDGTPPISNPRIISSSPL